MALVLALYVPADRADPDPAAMAAGFGVPDDGSDAFEVGRAETGSTCLLTRDPALPAQEAGEGRRLTTWRLLMPTLRAPWSARDLLPACAEAARELGGTWAPGARSDELDLLNAWDEAHARECRALAATCEATGSPLPPFRDVAGLDVAHRALLAIAEREPEVGIYVPAHVHGLDPSDGNATSFAVRFPLEGERAWLPLVDGVLFDPTGGHGGIERPLLFSRALLGEEEIVDVERAIEVLEGAQGEENARFRIVSPVEVLDEESLR